MTNQPFLGIDIGGSGIKGALVDLSVGDFVSDRLRIPTPAKSTPAKVAQVVARIVNSCADQLRPNDPVGITLPAVVTHGRTYLAANIDKSWVGADSEAIFTEKLKRRTIIVNDADAAGLAEARYGAAKDCDGLVMVITLGTGIGSALIYRGVLIPNTELGHLEIDGFDAEKRASANAKTEEDLSYSEYIPRLQRYFSHLEELFWPDLFVVGGGISRSSNKFLPKLRLHAPIVPAVLRNRAGIIGAAYLAAESAK
ncbi:MAG: ROK family protein [Propionibacteriaceae bacterium]|jgi:polyphosphate glucokinase|nr:ROK family protein [Propionibacteriaceae bacterium]